MSVITNNTDDIFYSEDIALWYDLYNEEVRLDSKSKSLNLAKSIVDEVSKAVVNEFGFTVQSKNLDTLSVNNFLHRQLLLLVTHLCIGGAVALKPYIADKKIGVVVVPATNFKAKFDSFGDLKECTFKSVIEDNANTFTLVEYHTYDTTTREYRIDYKLYKSSAYGMSGSGMGSEVPLTSCKETQHLTDFVVIEDVDRHLCVVKTLSNTIYQDVGQAIYAPAIELLYETYKQYDRVMWEYEGGELAIQANAELFHKVGSSTKKDNYNLPAGKGRLYIALPGASNDFQVETFAPTLRDTEYWYGLNNLLRRIEFACGLSYGIISDAGEKEMTATEIISSKQRYYITINSIREVIKTMILEILDNVCVLSGVVHMGLVDTACVVDFDIDDAILVSTREKIEEKLMLVDKGIWSVDEFKDWYNRKQRT